MTNAHPPLTVLTGEGVTDAVAGIVQNFTVTLYDSGNNRLEVGGDTITVQTTPSQSSIEIFDQLDGSYLVKYMITDA